MTIGLAVMTYNEAGDLPNLLASVEGCFDQIALVDNANPGSDDGTVDVFREWCERTGQAHVIDSFEWVDDYAAKRNYADSLLSTDWKSWANADDVIHGAHNLRGLADDAPAGLAAYEFDYVYAEDDELYPGVVFARERLVRCGRGEWVGRTHDLQQLDGPTRYVGSEIASWVRRPQTAEELEAAEERDRRIFARWAEEEPGSPWVILNETYQAMSDVIEKHDATTAAIERLQVALTKSHLGMRPDLSRIE